MQGSFENSQKYRAGYSSVLPPPLNPLSAKWQRSPGPELMELFGDAMLVTPTTPNPRPPPPLSQPSGRVAQDLELMELQVAAQDPELMELFGDAMLDPQQMQEKMEERIRSKQAELLAEKRGSGATMQVAIKEYVIRAWYVVGKLGGYNSANLQVPFYTTLGNFEQEPGRTQVIRAWSLAGYEVIRAWFVVGKLGGYNSANLQVGGLGSPVSSLRPAEWHVVGTGQAGREARGRSPSALLMKGDESSKYKYDVGTAASALPATLVRPHPSIFPAMPPPHPTPAHGGRRVVQVQLMQGDESSKYKYDVGTAASALPALMHNVGDLEFQDNLGRIWLDIGTANTLSLTRRERVDVDILSLFSSCSEVYFEARHLE
ncbi:unnamed protein product [Closterium sp. NIES-65]|nr:unnamed protein product [Closterium sp. NIES-65]